MATVTGQQQIIRNLQKVKLIIENNVDKGLENSLMVLQKSAIQQLESRIGTGRWPSLGTSVDGTSIRQPSNWKITPQDNHKVELRCISPHAAVVEVGGTSKSAINAGDYGHVAWPIGAQQGGAVIFSKTIRLQQGYHYLLNASTNPNTRKNMLNSVAFSNLLTYLSNSSIPPLEVMESLVKLQVLNLGSYFISSQ